MSSDNRTPPTEQMLPLTPGMLLRQARERQNLSVNELASKLYLSAQWVRDLEADQYGKDAALVYVRGYLCAYARAVDVPEAVLLEAFDATGWAQEKKQELGAAQAEPRVSRQARQSGSHWFFRLGLLLLCVLIVLVITWWYGQNSSVKQLQAEGQLHELTEPQPALVATAVQPEHTSEAQGG